MGARASPEVMLPGCVLEAAGTHLFQEGPDGHSYPERGNQNDMKTIGSPLALLYTCKTIGHQHDGRQREGVLGQVLTT